MKYLTKVARLLLCSLTPLLVFSCCKPAQNDKKEGNNPALEALAKMRIKPKLLHDGSTWPNFTSAFSPDSSLLATAGRDEMLRLYDTNTGKEIRAWRHAGEVNNVSFSPDGQLLVSRADSGKAHSNEQDATVFELSSGKIVYQWKTAGGRGPASFSADGKMLSLEGSYSGYIFDLSSGKKLQEWKHKESIHSVQLSPDKNRCLINDRDGTVFLYDVTSGRELQSWTHKGAIYRVYFSPDGRQVFVASGRGDKEPKDSVKKNNYLCIYDCASGKQVQEWQHESPVVRFTFSPNAKLVASLSEAGNRILRVYVRASGKLLHEWTIAETGMISPTFSPNGNYLAIGGRDKMAHIFEIESGKLLHSFKHGEQVYALQFSPDNRFALTGSFDGTARLFDLASGMELQKWQHRNFVFSAVFSPNGKHVVVESEASPTHLYDISAFYE